MLSSFKWVLLIVGLLGVAGADWPRFRGPAGDGKAEEGLPLKWSATEGVAWKKEMPGPGASSPIVWQNKVFLTCYSGYGLDPKQAGDMEQLKRHAICMNAENGETLWAKEIPADLPETKYQGTYITTHGYGRRASLFLLQQVRRVRLFDGWRTGLEEDRRQHESRMGQRSFAHPAWRFVDRKRRH